MNLNRNAMIKKVFIILFSLSLCSNKIIAQEFAKGLLQNVEIFKANKIVQHKTRGLILPFIDDFSSTLVEPDINKWKDKQAYINNTFSIDPITKGIATLDALDENGNCYYPTGALIKFYADSLTSEVIDLQGKLPSDSIYLSFFYQPHGIGFSPEPGDSLLLFLLTNTNTWVKVWSAPGSTVQNWRQVMIAVSAPNFLHNNFQFRFVNIATPGSNDDVWNLDYVKLAANRTKQDTILNDVAFTTPLSSVFANYLAMPSRHFLGFPAEQAPLYKSFLRNNKSTSTSVIAQIIAQQMPSTTQVYKDSTGVNMIANVTETATYTKYNTSSISNNITNLQHIAYIKSSGNPSDIKTNDTLIGNNILGNYFAYDDGSAEKAYYLFAAPNTPASAALQFHLNVPDSIQGLAIRFGTQIPSAAGKLFSVVLYKSLGSNTSTQQVLLQEDFQTVQYTNDREGFSNYKFTNPILLDSGTYYIGTMQPANSGSDTIYFGLDANNNFNTSKLFFNVDGNWQASNTIGSTMFRPLVGGTFVATNTSNIKPLDNGINVFPNPAKNILSIKSKLSLDAIIITDNLGKIIFQKNQNLIENINIEHLRDGLYFIQLIQNQKIVATKSFIKTK
jgi:hypothetical protein